MSAPDEFTFDHPYSLINNGTGIFTLKAHGMAVASYDVRSWGSEQACIEAAWQHAYGSDEDDMLASTLARAERAEAERDKLQGDYDAAEELNDKLEAALYQAGTERAQVEIARHTAEALLKEAVEALRTLRDYVDDASRGTLRYRGQSDISEMAGQDLVFLDSILTRIQEATK